MASTALDRTSLRAFASRLHLAERVEPYAPCTWSHTATDRPVLHLEDVSAIPFLAEIVGVEEYQHRARVRAASGDLFATVTRPDPQYGAYCQECLEIGQPEWIDLGSTRDPLAVAQACLEDGPFGQLVAQTRTAQGLVIHPYMSIEDIWTLSARLSRASGQPVTVLGPPPPVTWIANDKALFAKLVGLVLGSGWTPETEEATSPARLAALLAEMASRYERVGVKRTRCASAMGNLVLDAASVRGEEPAATLARVEAFLSRTEWTGDEPVLAVAWEQATSSPSTQWWIPPAPQGPPRLDGIFEQILEGDRKLFVGSRPSSLPEPVHDTLRRAARLVAEALQALGYVGRCSFDHLVLGDPLGEFSVRFTECNGRWGGTSTPMHLVDRVVKGRRPPYRAQDFQHDGLCGVTFGEMLDQLRDDAFDHQTQTGRYIFYNIGPLALHGKLDVIAVGATQAEAEQALLVDLPKRLGL